MKEYFHYLHKAVSGLSINKQYVFVNMFAALEIQISYQNRLNIML